MSGGVDSSVVATFLVRQGYSVTGAYMKQWSNSENVLGLCQWKKDYRDAMRVAAFLDIPLITLDFEKEYTEWVMGYMFAEYEAGRTPNPDVMCNKYIKFGSWLDRARSMGFDKMATGHYALLIERRKYKDAEVLYELKMAKDTEKDQTYFLNQLSQDQLRHVIFPLGRYTKKEVRAHARKFRLPTAEREESMGICFVGEIPVKDFLQQKIQKTPGNIVTEDGNFIGEHDGLAFYTIGQRHLGISITDFKIQNDKLPMYVVEKKFSTNELVVGGENSVLLHAKKCIIKDLNWITGHAPEFPLKCMVRLRHRQPLQDAECDMNNNILSISFLKSQRAITPGQFATLYKDSVCLGGGVIA